MALKGAKRSMYNFYLLVSIRPRVMKPGLQAALASYAMYWSKFLKDRTAFPNHHPGLRYISYPSINRIIIEAFPVLRSVNTTFLSHYTFAN